MIITLLPFIEAAAPHSGIPGCIREAQTTIDSSNMQIQLPNINA